VGKLVVGCGEGRCERGFVCETEKFEGNHAATIARVILRRNVPVEAHYTDENTDIINTVYRSVPECDEAGKCPLTSERLEFISEIVAREVGEMSPLATHA